MVAGAAMLSGTSGSSGLGPLIVEPDQGFAPIYSMFNAAKHTLDLTMYELGDKQAEATLIAAAARGVNVRVLLDQAYNGGPFNKPAFANLSANGVSVHWASTKVAITHQKSFVIDGKKAVIMTGNLTSRYYPTSRDFALVDTKKKDVAAIEATFALDWANTKGVAPAGSDLVWSPGAQDTLLGAIRAAKHTLRVENEEMKAPLIVAALEDAAKRGVDVEVLMTQQTTWKANFDALKAAGVHVRTYKASAPLYIHAKAIIVDARRVFLGSQNFSIRSLQSNRELGLIVSLKKLVNVVQATFAKDFAGATPW